MIYNQDKYYLEYLVVNVLLWIIITVLIKNQVRSALDKTVSNTELGSYVSDLKSDLLFL